MIHSISVCLVFAAFATGIVRANPPRFAKWLDSQGSSDLSTSARLAKKHDGIHTLARDMPDLVLFLPDDAAWAQHPSWVSKFEEDSDLRYEMILASGAEVRNSEGSALKSLQRHQNSYGMLDSGYGTPYFLDGEVLCLGEWDDEVGDYVSNKNECGTLSSPLYLKDAIVLKISSVILPSDLKERLE